MIVKNLTTGKPFRDLDHVHAKNTFALEVHYFGPEISGVKK